MQIRTFVFIVSGILLASNLSLGAINISILRSAKAGPITGSTDVTDDLRDYYDGQSAYSASDFTGAVTAAGLSSTDLLIVILPDDAFLASEVTAIDNFVSGGGDLFIIAEQEGFSPTENAHLRGLLSGLGSSMSLDAVSVGSGFSNTAASQLVNDSLNSGVSVLNYGNTNTISGSGTDFLLTSGLAASWGSYESFGSGRITMIADSNLVSNLGAASNDNGQLFDNIANAAVPEPSSFAAILGLSALALAVVRRRG